MNKEIILKSWGGVGDALVCTPAIKALKESFPSAKIILYCRSKTHWDVYKDNPNIASLRYLNAKYIWHYPKHLFNLLFNRSKLKFTPLSFQVIPPAFIYEKSIKEVIADIFKVELTYCNTELFLSKAENERGVDMLKSYNNVVILHIHSRSSANNHWPIEKWEELVRTMPEYTFIQLGMADEPHVTGAVDLRGKTKLREAFAIIKNAKSFVGVNSSFSHVTNAFSIPGVVLFGNTDPIIWGHDNNINIYKNVECAPCYYYLWQEKCPYNHECMHLITVSEVRNALLSQLSGV